MRNLKRVTNRASSSVKDPKEYITQITDMLGVDYSHSQLFVDDARGTSILNFIKKNGITQKRYGWKEVKWYDTNNELTQFTQQINGVWTLPITTRTNNTYTKKEYLIVHSGKKFYYVEFTALNNSDILADDNRFTFTEMTFENSYANNNNYKNNIENELSYGVVENGVLYVFCGTYIMIGDFDGTGIKARLVQNDENTYMPTISYGATFEEYNNTQWASGNVSQLLSKTYEEFNLLMNKVKETKLGLSKTTFTAYVNNGELVSTDTKTYTFPLTLVPYDANSNTPFDVNISLKASGTELINASSLTNNTFEIDIQEGSFVEGEVATQVSTVSQVESYLDFAFCIVYKDSSTGEEIQDITQYDYDDLPNIRAYLVVNKLYAPIIEGEDNYEVQYIFDNNEAEYINKCRFGIVYGINNNQNRLFVSGNENFINRDWHSCQTNDGKNSFTYFGDLSYTILGNETNAVAGYEIASDGTMIIMKSPSNTEPTIYLRTAELTHPINADGSYDETIYVEGYPVKFGSVGEGVVGFNNVQNLNGDTLIVSPNGVFGIEIDKAVNTNQRFALNRSRLIDTVLSSKNLKSSATYVFDNKLYLSVDGMCYIADARYKTQLTDDLSGHYQYEWWVWDNINARVFFEYDGKLFFGTEYGQLIGLDNKNYIDISYGVLKQSDGEIIYDNENNLVILPSLLSNTIEKLHDGDVITIINDNNNVYFKILNQTQFEINQENNKIYITDDDFDMSILTYYITQDFYTYLDYGIPYTIINIDEEERSFQLESNGELVDLPQNSFDIYKIASDNLRIVNVQATTSLEHVDSASNIEGNILYSEVYKNGDVWYYYDSNDVRVDLGSLIFNQFQISEVIKDKTYVFEISSYKENEQNSLNDIIFEMTFKDIVKAYFVSKTFNFGSSIYYKKIKQLTMTPDEANGTMVNFGYETSRTGQMFSAYTGKAFDFNDIDFEEFYFEGINFAKLETLLIL